MSERDNLCSETDLEIFVCNVPSNLQENGFEELLKKRYNITPGSTKFSKQSSSDGSSADTRTGTFIVKSNVEYFEILDNGSIDLNGTNMTVNVVKRDMTVIVKNYFDRAPVSTDLISEGRNFLFDKFFNQLKMWIYPHKIIYYQTMNVFFVTFERASDVRKLLTGEFTQMKRSGNKFKLVLPTKSRPWLCLENAANRSHLKNVVDVSFSWLLGPVNRISNWKMTKWVRGLNSLFAEPSSIYHLVVHPPSVVVVFEQSPHGEELAELFLGIMRNCTKQFGIICSIILCNQKHRVRKYHCNCDPDDISQKPATTSSTCITMDTTSASSYPATTEKEILRVLTMHPSNTVISSTSSEIVTFTPSSVPLLSSLAPPLCTLSASSTSIIPSYIPHILPIVQSVRCSEISAPSTTNLDLSHPKLLSPDSSSTQISLSSLSSVSSLRAPSSTTTTKTSELLLVETPSRISSSSPTSSITPSSYTAPVLHSSSPSSTDATTTPIFSASSLSPSNSYSSLSSSSSTPEYRPQYSHTSQAMFAQTTSPNKIYASLPMAGVQFSSSNRAVASHSFSFNAPAPSSYSAVTVQSSNTAITLYSPSLNSAFASPSNDTVLSQLSLSSPVSHYSNAGLTEQSSLHNSSLNLQSSSSNVAIDLHSLPVNVVCDSQSSTLGPALTALTFPSCNSSIPSPTSPTSSSLYSPSSFTPDSISFHTSPTPCSFSASSTFSSTSSISAGFSTASPFYLLQHPHSLPSSHSCTNSSGLSASTGHSSKDCE